MIRILIVDDQKSIRERLKYILESEPDFDIVGTVDNGYDAIEQVKAIEPDVVLMDMEMPDIDGVLATKIIAHSELAQKVKVLVLSSYDSSEYVTKSIRSGAKGYLLKGASAEEIRDAIRFVYRGYTQIAPGLFEQFIPDVTAPTPIPAVATRTSLIPPQRPKPRTPELAVKSASEIVLTGFNIRRRPRAITTTITAPESEIASFDAPTTHLGNKSLSWMQVVALMLAGLGLTGFIYVVRQGLRQPLSATLSTEQVKQLQETPFTGKIEALQVWRTNATVPGFVQEVKVKLGQPVRTGEVLMTIRNVDAERSLQEKAQQQQQAQQQQAKAASQQQQAQQATLQQQRQELTQQQQAAQQRLNILQQQITSYEQTIAPLRAQIATANLQLSQGQLATNQATLLRDKQTQLQRARASYEQQRIQHNIKVKQYNSMQQLFAAGAITRDRLETAKADMESIKVLMESARQDYSTAQASLQQLQQDRASSQPTEAKKLQLQQQLELKEQEDKVKKLREQWQQEQLSYQQLGLRLTNLDQQPVATASASPNSTAVVAPTTAPILVDVVAGNTGYIVELPFNSGDQVFTGNKLVGIANGQQLKATVEVDDRLAETLTKGQPAIVQVKVANTPRSLTARVANIAPIGENKKRKVDVEFSASVDSLMGQIASIYFPPQ
jgi:hemolysin D